MTPGALADPRVVDQLDRERIEDVQLLPTRAARDHRACLVQQTQVLRDHDVGRVHLRSQVGHRPISTLDEQVDHNATCRTGTCFEHEVLLHRGLDPTAPVAGDCDTRSVRAPDRCVRLVASRVVQDELGPPPADADEWSDQQWIDWLKATDAPEASLDRPAPATAAGRVTHSTGGRALGAAMIGLARAIYGQQAEPPAVVAEAGEPDDEGPFSVHLDFDQPDRSYVLARETDRTDQ